MVSLPWTVCRESQVAGQGQLGLSVPQGTNTCMHCSVQRQAGSVWLQPCPVFVYPLALAALGKALHAGLLCMPCLHMGLDFTVDAYLQNT